MKRGTYRHPKTLRLARRLGGGPCLAVGVLESLVEWAQHYALDGSLASYSAEDVAEGIGWTGDPAELLTALIAEAWIDEGDPKGPRRIHDWPDHADDGVHMALARAGRPFADGTLPKLGRFSKAEREQLEQALRTSAPAVGTPCARRAPVAAHAVDTALPSPAPPCQALPSPARVGSAEGNGNGHGNGRRARARLPLTPFPEDFTLTDADRQFALDGGLDPGLMLGALRDHALGKGRRQQDWHAAFRSWCRKEAAMRAERQPRRA